MKQLILVALAAFTLAGCGAQGFAPVAAKSAGLTAKKVTTNLSYLTVPADVMAFVADHLDQQARAYPNKAVSARVEVKASNNGFKTTYTGELEGTLVAGAKARATAFQLVHAPAGDYEYYVVVYPAAGSERLKEFYVSNYGQNWQGTSK